MTREEAALVRLRLMAHRAFGAMVENRRGGSEEAQKDLDAIDWAIATIQSKIARPQPDPATGLMPCGCGGVPVVVNEPGSWNYYPERWHIRCCEDPWKRERCGMRTSSVETKEEAKRIWNAAMGWREKE